MPTVNYRVIGAVRTTQMRTPTSAQDVEELTVSTRPSGVNFVRNVPYQSFTAGTYHADLARIATHIEHILASRPHVIGASPVQTVDAQGLIRNAVQFLVSYTAKDGTGPFQDTVNVPVQALHDDESFDAYFDPVVKVLAAAAAE